MRKLIIFTDLHILPEGGRIIGLDPYTRLLNGIQHVNKHHYDAERVIFTGDLTDKGDIASYKRLGMLLDQLKVPYSLLLGNHDHRENFRTAFPALPQDENGFIQQVIDLDDLRLIMLDTVNAPPSTHPDMVSGFLCDRRMAWLKRQIEEADERAIYIFMHHPPHITGFPGMDGIRLINDEAFYTLLNQHKNIRHIFAGHVHRTISGSAYGIPFSVFKSPCHQQPMAFEADATDLSVDEPAAYGIVFCTETGTIVHSEDYEISPLAYERGMELMKMSAKT